MRAKVRNVKMFRGHDGMGYNAVLYFDGKRVALAINLANGGETFYQDVADRELLEAVEAYAAAMPPVKYGLGEDEVELAYDLDLLVEDLVEDTLAVRELVRLCRTNVVYRDRQPGELADHWMRGKSWITRPMRYRPEFKDQIERQFGGPDKVFIANEEAKRWQD